MEMPPKASYGRLVSSTLPHSQQEKECFLHSNFAVVRVMLRIFSCSAGHGDYRLRVIGDVCHWVLPGIALVTLVCHKWGYALRRGVSPEARPKKGKERKEGKIITTIRRV